MSDSGLERAFLGDEPEFTAEQVAERAGVSVEATRRLWRSLGFAELADEPAFTPADVDALSIVASVLEDGLIDLDIALNVTRGMGLSMARLADWEVGALVQRVGEHLELEGIPDQRREMAEYLVRHYGDRFERLLTYAWRRHLIAAVTRMESSRAIHDDPHSTDVTVGFADLVNFTGLSNDLSRDKIGDLVELFEARCGDVIATMNGRLIKSMGDAVLFVNNDPLGAFQTAEGIINVIGRNKRMPDVRVGLASGSVVMRLGDVFGPPVNLASRLTDVARRNRIIVDRATADLLSPEDFETRSLPARPMRGFGDVEPVAVRRIHAGG